MISSVPTPATLILSTKDSNLNILIRLSTHTQFSRTPLTSNFGVVVFPPMNFDFHQIARRITF